MKQAIDQLLKAYHLEKKFDNAKVIEAYYAVAGEIIVRHTTSVKMKDVTLFIAVDNAALRNELLYSREQLMFLVNEKVGKDVVERVVIR